jgi:ATP-binding cassette subfamily B protein
MKNKKEARKKRGLWAIMAPVRGYIKTAMGLSAAGGVSALLGYIFLAYVLSIATGGSIALFGLSFRFNQAFLILTMVVILSFVIKYYATIVSHLGAFKLEEILRTHLANAAVFRPCRYDRHTALSWIDDSFQRYILCGKMEGV